MATSKSVAAFWVGVMTAIDNPTLEELMLIETQLPELIKEFEMVDKELRSHFKEK